MSNEPISRGLEGVVAGETSICTIGTIADGLFYRGYSVVELVEKCTFDEVAYLLLRGELPTSAQLNEYQQRVAVARQLPESLIDLFKSLPTWTPPMDALRTAVSVLAHFDQDVDDNSREANLRKAERLLAKIPLAIAAHHRVSKKQQPIESKGNLSHAANFLYVLRGEEASESHVKAVDVSLILYAEHEFNASTFTARVICATESDLHSSITGAIGALKGRLHGGANEKVVELLQQAGGPDTAEQWIRDALARKEKIMGFGHRVYRDGDIRAKILKEYAYEAAKDVDKLDLETTAEAIEKVMLSEKKLHPNLDWPAGRLYHCLDLEIPLYTPIFVMSRVAGWSAHVMEQLENNRLIRPRANYVGPDVRSVPPIEQRS